MLLGTTKQLEEPVSKAPVAPPKVEEKKPVKKAKKRLLRRAK